jgi:hypothetical protein
MGDQESTPATAPVASAPRRTPAPMDSAPASSPAAPVTSTVWFDTPLALIPNTNARLLTSPSLAPNTAARKLPERRLRPRAASARTMDPLVSSHGGRDIDIDIVGGPRLSALREGENKDRSEMAPGIPKRASVYRHVGAFPYPHRAVSANVARGGPPRRQRQQDLALLAGASSGQIPVHGGFGPLVGQVLTPTPKIGSGRCRPAGLATSSLLHQPMMRQDAMIDLIGARYDALIVLGCKLSKGRILHTTINPQYEQRAVRMTQCLANLGRH